ncbi:uncharacterized protein LOC106009768 [Heterocephalus glaber]|uniref:Uncharacterized protein LOC106009768 n=1 Tax=Heterocephalus glaber TaxID=10181 RepID=A0AAX6T9Y6_HETGA|nr:uncharacterized protein LOC106009768 [Heterocephalus glaber]
MQPLPSGASVLFGVLSHPGQLSKHSSQCSRWHFPGLPRCGSTAVQEEPRSGRDTGEHSAAELKPEERSSFFVLHFLVELHSQENPPAELLAQLEQAEPTEAQPMGPAPAPTEVPRAEPEPAPPAASCPALGPQPESVAAPSPAAVLGHPVVAWRSVSPPELRLGPAPGPLPLFPSLMLALAIVFTIALISWIYINNRTSF